MYLNKMKSPLLKKKELMCSQLHSPRRTEVNHQQDPPPGKRRARLCCGQYYRQP